MRKWLSIHALGDCLDGPARKEFDEAIGIADERLGAADVLGVAPHRAEAMHVLSRALDALERAVDCLERSASVPGDVRKLLGDAPLDALGRARERLQSAPARDGSLMRSDLESWRATRKLAHRACRRLRRIGRRRRDVLVGRVTLALTACLGLGVATLALLGVLGLRDRVAVVASGDYGGQLPDSPYRAQLAVDGNATTEWLTPNEKDGWIELRYRDAIDVASVRVVNAQNPPFQDRGVKELDIELFYGDTLKRRAHLTFPSIETTREARTVAVETQKVNRVRLVARSHHGLGAGLAEVEIRESARPAPAHSAGARR